MTWAKDAYEDGLELEAITHLSRGEVEEKERGTY